MKLLSSFILSWFFIDSSFAQSSNYPFVAAISGRAMVDDQVLSLWKSLGSHKKIELSVGATLRIEISEQSFLILSDSASIKLGPWDHKTKSYDWYLLEGGSVRVVNKSATSFILKTDFAEFDLKNLDALFEFKRERFELKATSLLGELEFRGLGRVDVALLKPGLSSYFVAEYENGEALFDYLLKGKKSARGKMTQPILVSDQEVKKIKSKYWLEKMDLKKLEALRYSGRKADQICDKPFGAFNECVFLKEDNKCVRLRCNANGQWAEKTIVPGSHSANCNGTKPNLHACGDF